MADSSLRLACDWRSLNSITVKNQACLPNIDDLFDSVRGARHFSKLDLMSGIIKSGCVMRIFQRKPLKTVPSIPVTVMGFWVTHALATFMGVMNDVLGPFIRNSFIVFLYDILILSKYWNTWMMSCQHLNVSNFYRKVGKCLFATDSTRFLGHIVTGDTICPGLGKLQAVTNRHVPSSVKEVRQVFGFAN